MQISSLSQLNHVINVLANGTGTDQGGLDTSVSNNFSCKGTQKCFSLIGRLSELFESLSVRNHIQGGSRLTLHSIDGSAKEGSSAVDESGGSYKEQQKGKDSHGCR
mmetsp:Transcript_70191/g.203543  ORF Transcript_70191/g.203543 Transcript_70191/m.203543 type:complete len:106 (+) Transcript_70191:291-608(+)